MPVRRVDGVGAGMHRPQGRIIGVCIVGWWLSTGVVWSADVYEFSAIVAALLVMLPWALAGGAFALMSSASGDVHVDVTKMALQGALRSEHFNPGDTVLRQGEEVVPPAVELGDGLHC